MKNEMILYKKHTTWNDDIAENILSELRTLFSKYEIEITEDKEVLVRVLEKELKIIEDTEKKVREIIIENAQNNSVLRNKLAHYYRV